MWFVEPMERKGADGKGSGLFNLIAHSDEGGGFHECCTHDHESADAASACEEGQQRAAEITGFPAFREVELFDFGYALGKVKRGEKVARRGWNGKGMFIFLVPGSTFKVNRPPLLGIYPEGTEINYRAHIDMRTADGQIVPWVASQTDMLAEDWEVVDQTEASITINGQKQRWDFGRDGLVASYAVICAKAGVNLSRNPTVTWGLRSGAGGSLIYGESVTVVDGMVFNAGVTGNA